MTTIVDIVEDQRLIRALLSQGLAESVRLRVRWAFEDAEMALERWMADPPEAAIIDIRLPGMNGVQLGVQAKRQSPHLGIVLLSSHAYPALLKRLPADAADGWAYLLKDDVDMTTIADAVDAAVSGRRVVDAAVTRLAGSDGSVNALSDRQAEMLRLLASGKSNAAIAEAMHLTRKSVENAINRLYSTLGLDTEDAETNRRVIAAHLAGELLDVPR